MGVILEPEVGEEALHYHHGNTHKKGVGDTKLCLEIETIIGKHPWVDDPKLEMQRIEEQKQKEQEEAASMYEPFGQQDEEDGQQDDEKQEETPDERKKKEDVGEE